MKFEYSVYRNNTFVEISGESTANLDDDAITKALGMIGGVRVRARNLGEESSHIVTTYLEVKRLRDHFVGDRQDREIGPVAIIFNSLLSRKVMKSTVYLLDKLTVVAD